MNMHFNPIPIQYFMGGAPPPLHRLPVFIELSVQKELCKGPRHGSPRPVERVMEQDGFCPFHAGPPTPTFFSRGGVVVLTVGWLYQYH